MPPAVGGRHKQNRFLQFGMGGGPGSHTLPSRTTQHAEGRPGRAPTSITPVTKMFDLRHYAWHHKLVNLDGSPVKGRKTRAMYDACVAAAQRQIPQFVEFNEEGWRHPSSPVDVHTDQALNPLAQLADDPSLPTRLLSLTSGVPLSRTRHQSMTPQMFRRPTWRALRTFSLATACLLMLSSSLRTRPTVQAGCHPVLGTTELAPFRLLLTT